MYWTRTLGVLDANLCDLSVVQNVKVRQCTSLLGDKTPPMFDAELVSLNAW
jgi:hypothetical protein